MFVMRPSEQSSAAVSDAASATEAGNKLGGFQTLQSRFQATSAFDGPLHNFKEVSRNWQTFAK